jgi:hypothetical protein
VGEGTAEERKVCCQGHPQDTPTPGSKEGKQRKAVKRGPLRGRMGINFGTPVFWLFRGEKLGTLLSFRLGCLWDPSRRWRPTACHAPTTRATQVQGGQLHPREGIPFPCLALGGTTRLPPT